MKKLVLFFAVATAVAFASCGNKQAATTETEEAAPVEAVAVEEVDAVEEINDSTIVVEPVAEEVAEEVAE